MKYNTTMSVVQTNLSTTGSSEYLEISLLLQMIVLSAWAILGVVGNAIILVTGIRRSFCVSDIRLRQEYKTSFITNLAVADILILVYGIPLHLIQEKRVPMSEFVCRYLVPFRDVLALASILTIMAISLERAFAIVDPFSLETSQHYTKYLIVVIWVVAYLLAGLPMVFVMNSTAELFCVASWSNARLQKVHQTCAVLLIIIPGLVTTISYTFCWHSLRKFRQRRKSSSECLGIQQQWSFVKQTQSVSRIAIVLVAIFWLCNLPLVTYSICVQYQLITPSPKSRTYSFAVLICMFFAASGTNPVVLIAMSPLYRESAMACVRSLFSRGCGIFRYKSASRAHSFRDSINRSEHISIANNDFVGDHNANNKMLNTRRQSVTLNEESVF